METVEVCARASLHVGECSILLEDYCSTFEQSQFLTQLFKLYL